MLSQAFQGILWTVKCENHGFRGHNNFSSLSPLVFPARFSSKCFHGDLVMRAPSFGLCPIVLCFGVTGNRQVTGSFLRVSLENVHRCALLWRVDSQSLGSTRGLMHGDHRSRSQGRNGTGGRRQYFVTGALQILTNPVLWIRRRKATFREHSLNPGLASFLPRSTNHLATPEEDRVPGRGFSAPSQATLLKTGLGWAA